MKLKWLFVSLLICSCVACGSNSGLTNGGEGNGPDTTGTKGNKSDTTGTGNKQGISIEKALFTNPRTIQSGGSDPDIINKLISYLNYTPKGARVYINIYLFNDEPLVNAVKRAYNRGVEMHVLIDYSTTASMNQNQQTINESQALFKKPSGVTLVKNNIYPAYSIDHNKYVLFSEVDLPNGDAKDLVFATSHNFIKSAETRLNDAVVMTDSSLYHIFFSNWHQIAKYSQNEMNKFEYTVKNAGDSIQAIFFPRRLGGKWDGHGTIVEKLDNNLDFTGYQQDTVRVLMARWTRVNEAKKLTQLEKVGVTVQVITVGHTSAVSDKVKDQLSLLKKAGGYVKYIDRKTEGSDHSKTMLVKGIWKGKKQRVILTGSYNYGIVTLKGSNNFLLILKNSVLFDAYWNNFNVVKRLF